MVLLDYKLARHEVTQAEWTALDWMAKQLEVFQSCTDLVSGARYPTMCFISSVYNLLHISLERSMEDPGITDWQKDALEAAAAKLAKYYRKTDSLPYFAATFLDPAIKKSYWDRAQWSAQEKSLGWLNFIYNFL